MIAPELLAFPATEPVAIYGLRDQLLAVDLIAAALVEFDFFTEVESNPGTSSEIAARLGIAERPCAVLVTLAKALGFLIADASGCLRIHDSAIPYLVSTSPFCVRPYYAAMAARPQTREMVEVLRTGKPARWASADPQAWADAMRRPDFATSFTGAMDCRGLLLGQKLARGLTLPAGQRILDVAGGSGVYACCLAAAWEGSSATVFEQPPVDAIARDAITRRGCAERVSVIAGNMFDDPWPTGFTMHLLSNVVHDWGIPKVRELFAKSAAALESGARIVIHDAHIEDTDDGPLAVAAYSALLMNITEGRCYRFGEMREWLDEAGFAVERVGPTGLARTYICAVRR